MLYNDCDLSKCYVNVNTKNERAILILNVYNYKSQNCLKYVKSVTFMNGAMPTKGSHDSRCFVCYVGTWAEIMTQKHQLLLFLITKKTKISICNYNYYT